MYLDRWQGDRPSFSVEFNADRDGITLSDGGHFETKGLMETLVPQKTEPETEVTLTVAELVAKALPLIPDMEIELELTAAE